MNIVMVGSTKFPVIAAGVEIADFLNKFSIYDDAIHTRDGQSGFDAFVAEAALFMGFKVRRFPAEGGASNFIRDVEMVKTADEVYAFFDADHVGEGGTQHVIDKALDQHKRSYSYVWTDRSGLILVGSADGGEGDADDHEEPARGDAQVDGEAPSERARRRSEAPQERGRSIGYASGRVREDDTGSYPED